MNLLEAMKMANRYMQYHEGAQDDFDDEHPGWHEEAERLVAATEKRWAECDHDAATLYVKSNRKTRKIVHPYCPDCGKPLGEAK